jgi:hypothetical protein
MKRPIKQLLLGVLVIGVLSTGFLVFHGTAHAASMSRAVHITSSAAPNSVCFPNWCAVDASGTVCGPDLTCVYRETGYTGEGMGIESLNDNGNTYADLNAACNALFPTNNCDWHTRSFINDRAERSWLNQFTTGNHGNSYCMGPFSHRQDISSHPAVTDQWLLLSANTNLCP